MRISRDGFPVCVCGQETATGLHSECRGLMTQEEIDRYNEKVLVSG